MRNQTITLPPATESALRTDAEGVAQHNLRAAGQSAVILDAFKKAEVPLIFIKGLTLGELAYGNPFMKSGWDIDILVPIEQLSLAAAQLTNAGYLQVNPLPCSSGDRLRQWHASRKESLWRKADGGVHVELHTRLADNPGILARITARAPSQSVRIAPGIVLPTLADDELFAFLCVHGASSAWFRLKWLADLAGFLRGRSPADISRLHVAAQEQGAGRTASCALLLARDVFGVEVEPRLAKAIEADRANGSLARMAWRQLTRISEPTEIRYGTVGIHLVQFLLHPGLRFKLGELRRQIADAVGNRR